MCDNQPYLGPEKQEQWHITIFQRSALEARRAFYSIRALFVYLMRQNGHIQEALG